MPNSSNYNSYVQRDAAAIWHPFTQHQIEPFSIPITRGEGCWLYGANGDKYLDAISSWWVNIHGHGHPYLAKKVYEQALKIEQVIFAGFTHEPAIRLSERLLSHLPKHFHKVFFSDNGSTAVEVAIKMALQFYYNQGHTKKRKILALQDAYHGDTFGAMSLGAPSSFNAPFQDMLFEVEFISQPGNPEACLQDMKNKLEAEPDVYAAFIFEPLVQGAGGMLMYEPSTLDALIQLAHEHAILCIADEIMTGFGRTGKWFAMDYLSHKPDIVCLSKGLTGGMMAMGVTCCSNDIFHSFLSEDRKKTLFHSHSFTANPLACAAANASLDIMEKEETWSNIQRVSDHHEKWVASKKGHPIIQNVRQRGTILALDLHTGESTGYMHPLRDRAYQYFIKKGVLLRPLGNTLYILAPYCIQNEELDLIYKSIEEFAEELKPIC
ncbi:adenosylmethionine--8-amino-7-oxononanoate transaminase [Aquirufa rosea]|uniref:Adenosylmethionine-8-amino-7-oxononanoate aminotransferase n=1 Tax=Aquirufa rosea TaxID=2509241 RepID=A0A4Q1BZV9_9BACT|nr:adenosylmethionine--8-amino-7-oxononanoate transaminase [Aquirufa rosea]RXK49702.1 adenosylmethionine--8-amino-7-oxononanoate transaminase [Aquirufa rosea]